MTLIFTVATLRIVLDGKEIKNPVNPNPANQYGANARADNKLQDFQDTHNKGGLGGRWGLMSGDVFVDDFTNKVESWDVGTHVVSLEVRVLGVAYYLCVGAGVLCMFGGGTVFLRKAVIYESCVPYKYDSYEI